MNEHELTDAFENILPEQPSTKGWAGATRQRRQRQRALAGAAAVAVVAAVAIPLGLGFGNSSPQVQATPAPSNDSASENMQLIPDACRSVEGDAVPLPAGVLSADPEQIWLCGQDDGLGTTRRTVGAPDALGDRAAEAVQTFNDLPLERGVASCALDFRVADYTMVIEYGDGSHSAVTTDDCGFLRDVTDRQDYFRERGGEYLDTLHDLWTQQRAETDFSFKGTDDLCSNMNTSVWRPLDLSTLTRAVACDGDDQRPIELPGELAADLLASLDATETGRPEEILFGGPPELVFLTPEGDPLSLQRWGDEGRWAELLTWDEGAENHAWAVPPELQQRIDDHLATVSETEPTPSEMDPTLGSEDPAGLTSKVCDDVQSGRIKPDDLAASATLPEGAERVWLCGDLNNPFGGPLGPREPLVTDPDRVIRKINALPAPDATMCTEIGGLIYHLAIDYPDGTRRVISAETVNCEFVGGWDGRTGGAKLLDAVEGYWQDQRDETTEPYIAEPALCDTFPRKEEGGPGYYSFLPVDRSELTRGAVCGLPADAADFSAEPVQRWLEPELVRAIADGETTPVGDEGWRVPAGLPYLVLLNRFGDPVTYSMGTDGELYVPNINGSTQVWKPSAEVADRWSTVLEDFRTTPFVPFRDECSGYDPATLTGDLSRIKDGVACVGDYAVPELGPELDAQFATDVALRFDAEATTPTFVQWNSANYLVLRDVDGEPAQLYWDGTEPASLIDEAGERAWRVPDDVRMELERYGFDFTPE